MPKELETPQPEIVVADAADVFRTYSNHINIMWNSFDVRLNFGDSTVMPGADGKVHVQTKAVITVSWTEAKQIAEILAQVIERFEKVNGPIKRAEELKIS
ncbi:MAG: DUF3467 domain-containing protein [Bryobacteraceae bacterium]